MNGRERLSQWAKTWKTSLGRHRLVWLVILAGVFLLLLPSGGEEGEQQEGEPETWAFDLAETEARLAQVLSRIDGAGEVSVMLTVQNGPQKRLAEDRDSGENADRTETVVLSKGSSNQETVTVQELFPKFQGAVLVCPGGDDPEVRLKLTEATAALTGLGSDKISISKGK